MIKKMCKFCKVKKNKNISPKTSPNTNNKTTLQILKNQPYKFFFKNHCKLGILFYVNKTPPNFKKIKKGKLIFSKS